VTPRRGTFDERVRRTAAIGLAMCVAALAAGLVLAFAGAPSARAVLLAGLGGLVVLPIANVVAALVEEIDRRDWAFAAVAVAVLAILVYNVLASFD
jgi:drug/metabolite transporter (DMT)-like permease